MIRFDVSTLVKARLGTSLTLDVNVGPQDLADLEVDFLRGTIQVIRVQSGLVVQGTIESQLMLECVRCLETFVFPFTLELEEIFRLSGAGLNPEYVHVVGDDGWINLIPLLREQVWVDIPMKPLCDLNCKGLCPQCGANLNIESCACDRAWIDPRLAVLKNLTG
ncbi:MAG TPA: DUF177 domain-containing protein [Chloroflexi bacterium]|nr:DUF177 domain-containing protein [Chloroflexota bacterium]